MPTAVASSAERSSPTGLLRVVAGDIKLAHSVFAMPFAVLAAFMAAAPAGRAIDWPRFGVQLLLVVLAMVLARSVAMLANRILDRHIDAANPRTARRAIPGGRLGVGAALAVLGTCAAGFMGVCVLFGALYGNWWPAGLGLPVLGWLSVYPLCKRFTIASHLVLGSALAISPLAAALAVSPPALGEQAALWLLAGMVLFWVAGFDVIYALRDAAVDREQGLHSVPGRLGARATLAVSRLLHVTAALLLAVAAVIDPRFGLLFMLGVLIVCGLLLYEHRTVAHWGTSRIAMAFFAFNGLISCLLGLLGVLDVLW